MTDREALDRLIEAVEAGTLDTREFLPWVDEWGVAILVPEEAYNGSLDAAKALHEAVLPGWLWRVMSCHVSDDAFVEPDWNDPVHGDRLQRDFPPSKDWLAITDLSLTPGGNPARAWLLAILKALREGAE